MPGFHIPGIDVRLLSPQVLLQLIGGQSVQTVNSICMLLGNEITLDAGYCPCSNLPFLQMGIDGKYPRSFWSNAFAYTESEAKAFPTLLESANVNLSTSQKEVLLWHQCLSHASISWIQRLMHNDCKWLQNHDSLTSLDLGPFIPCKSARSSNCMCLPSSTQLVYVPKLALVLLLPNQAANPLDLVFQDELNGNRGKSLNVVISNVEIASW
jgi:hypothetical protein